MHSYISIQYANDTNCYLVGTESRQNKYRSNKPILNSPVSSLASPYGVLNINQAYI